MTDIPTQGHEFKNGFIATGVTSAQSETVVTGTSRQGGRWKLIGRNNRWTALRGQFGVESRITDLLSFEAAMNAVDRCEASIANVMTTQQVRDVVEEHAQTHGMGINQIDPWTILLTLPDLPGCISVEASDTLYPIVTAHHTDVATGIFAQVRADLFKALIGVPKPPPEDDSPAFRRPLGESWKPYRLPKPAPNRGRAQKIRDMVTAALADPNRKDPFDGIED